MSTCLQRTFHDSSSQGSFLALLGGMCGWKNNAVLELHPQGTTGIFRLDLSPAPCGEHDKHPACGDTQRGVAGGVEGEQIYGQGSVHVSPHPSAIKSSLHLRPTYITIISQIVARYDLQ